MSNSSVCQAETIVDWKFLLGEAERMLAESKDKEARKELRYSVRAFRTLIRQKAPLPGMKNSRHTKAA